MDHKAELARERRARLAAERLLKLRQEELARANVRLGKHAVALSEEIIEKREEAQLLRGLTEEAKQELILARGEIDIAKRRLWSSIETIEDGFSVFDADARLVIANSAYLSAFDGIETVRPGVRYSEILALMTEEGIVDPEGLSSVEWQEMMARRWAMPQPAPVTIRLWNGAYIKLVDRRGDDGDTASMALNTTATIRYQKRIKSASEKAQAASQAKSAFLARMSHELRTPMNGVVGMADLLMDSELDDEQRTYVDTIRSSGEALLQLINNILDFSKLEADKQALQPEVFDLRHLIGEINQLFRPALAAKPVKMALDYQDGLGSEFFGDAGRVRQVLTNLIGNAVKFTEEGQILIAVTGQPAADQISWSLSFRIEDTGIGIPADMVEHIFGEFTQVEDQKNRTYEGTGLGLAICRQLAELMGGTISVESAPGQGSRFDVSLTLGSADGRAVEPLASDVAAPAAEAPTPKPVRRMRILAAEDNKTNRLVFEKMLKSLDLELCFAENGVEAIDKWRGFRPDLIFMDISMPEMDGMQATSRIRAEEQDKDLERTPIVALTAHAVGGDKDEILAAGLDHYMTKPLRKAEIVAQIEEYQPEDSLPVRPPDPDPGLGGSSASLNLTAAEPRQIGPRNTQEAARNATAVRQIWDGLHRDGSGPKSFAELRDEATAGGFAVHGAGTRG